MEAPLLELISDIMEKGKFSKSRENDVKLKSRVENLFKLHKKERTQQTARMVYSAIADLARIGKGEMAHRFALRFEEEIAYEELE